MRPLSPYTGRGLSAAPSARFHSTPHDVRCLLSSRLRRSNLIQSPAQATAQGRTTEVIRDCGQDRVQMIWDLEMDRAGCSNLYPRTLRSLHRPRRFRPWRRCSPPSSPRLRKRSSQPQLCSASCCRLICCVLSIHMSAHTQMRWSRSSSLYSKKANTRATRGQQPSWPLSATSVSPQA